MRLTRRQTPKFRRNVRARVGSSWRYYKSYHSALQRIDPELYQWFCVEEPAFSPRQVLREMQIKSERNPKGGN